MDVRIEDSMEVGSGNFFIRQIIGSVGTPTNYSGGGIKASNGPDDPILERGDSSNSPNSVDDIYAPDRIVDTSFRYEKDRYIKNRSNVDPLRGLFFEDDVMELLEDLKRWYLQRQWYQDHGIPWRTGVMLHGPGGTGKSSLSRATAQTLGIPLYQYCLNTMTDRDFVREWERMRTPCVVALEDFDTVFHGRESVTTHQSLSFECVLNQISGISALNGVLLMLTTNHVEHIDAAMGQIDQNGRPTRPGRIDRILYMGQTTEKQRRKIAVYTLDWATDLIESTVASGEGTTAAQFQSMCVQAALERIVKQKKDEECKPMPQSHGSSPSQPPQLRLLKSF
jgi:SpoVK/Ycf46/Vps4 family AAA+-type ATPase